MADLRAFIDGLPKVELHVNHVGSASPRIVVELAARHEGSSPGAGVADLAAAAVDASSMSPSHKAVARADIAAHLATAG